MAVSQSLSEAIPDIGIMFNLLAPGDYLDEGFTTPTDLPGRERLFYAIENAQHKIVRTMDDQFELVETENDCQALQAEVEVNEGKTTIVKTLDDEDYDIVPSESGGYQIAEKAEAE
jgi:hypothetical protein